ncbi:type II toxin-antitoxin system HigB family toxin [bacterium]|nr:type II toxin-antitoxin system HigB family toxin [bacterium]
MHIISYKKIRDFNQIHSNAENPLNHWYRIAKNTDFNSFAEVKALFPSADQVGNFVVFNIGGNNFRLIALLRYKINRLFIRSILTHSEYDKNEWKEDTWYQNSKK